MRALRRITALLASAGLLSIACTRVLGIETLPAEPPREAGLPEVGYASAACGTCARKECDVPERACLSDKVCVEAYRALASCAVDDVRCRMLAERPLLEGPARTNYLALDGCRRTACTAECYGSKGFLFGYEACRACVDEGCTTAQLGCVRSGAAPSDAGDGGLGGGAIGDCERLIACVQSVNPPNPDVANSCSARYGEPAAYKAWATCATGLVCDKCEFSPDLRCVSRYRWAAPPGSTVSLSVGVQDAISGKPRPAAQVLACLSLNCADCTTANAVARGTTDDAGMTTLELPTPAPGFLGCFRTIAGGTYRDTLGYYARPFNRSTGVLLLAADAATIDALYFAASVSRADGTGTISFVTRDCGHNNSSGLSVELTGHDTYYLADGSNLPVKTMTATGRAGGGVFFNVPPGVHELVMRRGAEIVGRMTVHAVKDVNTVGLLYPSAAP